MSIRAVLEERDTHLVTRRPEIMVALAAVLLLASVLTGCLKINGVTRAMDEPPSDTYTVWVDLSPTETTSVPFRGVLAVRYPGEWDVTDVTATGPWGGTITPSSAIAEYYETTWEAVPVDSDHNGDKAGYEWWAGYGPAFEVAAAAGSAVVEIVFDQNDVAGDFQLDFVTGVADAGSPEDPTVNVAPGGVDGSLWSYDTAADTTEPDGSFLDVSVVVNAPPEVYAGEAVTLYTGVGQTLTYSGTMYDPDSSSFDGLARFGDGGEQAFALTPAPDAPGPGWYLWTWSHTWSAPGSYTVEIRVRDAEGGEDIQTVTTSVGGSPFSDVPAGHEFFTAIMTLRSMGVVDGYSDGTYGLYDPVLRAQVAKMAVVAYGLHDAVVTNLGSPSFSDVAYTGETYPFDYVEEAADNELVNGYADDTFRPWNPLTRIALVRILVRAAGTALAEPPPSYDLPFNDVSAEDAYYVGFAHYNGLVSGTSETTFNPYGVATRGHVAKILWNALGL